jgi:hypothetical protein
MEDTEQIISITLDNASNNDVDVKDLKAKFIFRRCKQIRRRRKMRRKMWSPSSCLRVG